MQEFFMPILFWIVGVLILFWLPLITRFVIKRKPLSPRLSELIMFLTYIFGYQMLELGEPKKDNENSALIFFCLIFYYVIKKGYKPEDNKKELKNEAVIIEEQNITINTKKNTSNSISVNNIIIFILFVLLVVSTYYNYNNTYRLSNIENIQNSIPENIINNKNLIALINITNYKGEIIKRGTGFIIGKNGYLATNYHVIEEPKIGFYSDSSIEANINGKKYTAGKIIFTNKEKDIAIIKFNFYSESKVVLDNLYTPKQGETIYVIGNPLGLETTVSNGIISAIRGDNNYIQITAPISSGSSGSPVFNSKGNVIGIATFIYRDGQNLNFAIPVKTIFDLIIFNEISINDLDNDDEKFSNDLNYKATKYFNNKNIQNAKYYYYLAYKIYEKNIDAYLNLAMIYMLNDKNYDKAKNYIDIAYSKNSFDNRIYKLYSMVNFHNEDFLGALDNINKSIKLKTDDSEAHLLKAQILAKLDRFNDAINECDESIKLNGRNVQTYIALARIYTIKEDFINSKKYYDIALKVDPNSADAHFGLAIIYIHDKDKLSALKKLEILKKLNNDYYSNFLNKEINKM